MRRLMTALAIGSALFSAPWPAAARTPGRVCRIACGPRIDEQCGGLVGRDKRRCRKPLVRACKTTSPEIACETTAALTQELADRQLLTADPRFAALTLCATGQFSLRETGGASGGAQLFRIRTGAWEVRLVDGALTLSLDDGTTAAVSHDASGVLFVDDGPAIAIDAAARCAADAVAGPGDDVGDDDGGDAGDDGATGPGGDPADPTPVADDGSGRVIDAVRAITDRALVISASDGDPNQQRELVLCGSGRSIDATITLVPLSFRGVPGTWTVEASGASIVLELHDEGGGEPRFGLEFRADGAVLIDEAVVEQRDARQQCDDAELAERLTGALNGQAFFFTLPAGNFVIRHKLGLCDSGRYRLETTTVQVGTWRVRVSNGVANLIFTDDDGNIEPQAFPVAFNPAGTVTVQGSTPVDEPSLVEAACQS